MKHYPQNWGLADIKYWVNGQVYCEYCGEFVHEDEIKKDTDGDNICTDCAETITCSNCGEINPDAKLYNMHMVCPKCIEALEAERLGDLADYEDMVGDGSPCCCAPVMQGICTECGEHV